MTNETLRGTVSRVFFANPDSPWMAGVLALDDGQEVRFNGKCVAQVGDKLELAGRWGQHPKFGRQFEAETGLVKMDESPEALAHMLSTDSRFKGLGPVRARKVVDAALALSGDGDIASALKDYAAEISSRAGCPLDVVENAGKVWNERRSYFDALALLCEQGWSNAQAQTIIHVLDENAPAIVRENPYLLIGRIPRFGFRTVDVVAQKMGIETGNPQRLVAGVAYCLDQEASGGNTWTTREGLLYAASQELRPDTLDGEDRIASAMEGLIAAGAIHIDVSPLGTEIVADARLAKVEFDVFERLLAGLGEKRDIHSFKLDGPRAQAVLLTLNEGQAKAVWGFWTHRFSVVSGGAGVGKTYTMRAVCEIAEENGLVVALCAPTGKAARKLSHATERNASTVHRLLEPKFNEETGDFRFTRGPSNPIKVAVSGSTGETLLLQQARLDGGIMPGWNVRDVDLVVVDEVSMVDVRLMRSLLLAMKSGTRLLLVGDHHQIPSVSPGAILRDLLAAQGKYDGAVHILTEIVRQAGDLARNTTALLGGVVVASNSAVWGIEHTEKGHEDSAAAHVAMLVEAVVTDPNILEPFGRPLDLAWDVQVLAPQKKGELGTYALNVHLQKLHQRLRGNAPPEPTKKDERPKPMIGDRVIWTRNDYTLDLYNGTQALVMGFKKGGAMEIHTEDGRDVTVPPEKRIRVEVAYAMTIHKSQGSEWPFVVLIGSSSHWHMHDRNLFYTGASRAAESLTIVGDRGGIKHFVSEKKSAARQTFGALIVHGWQPNQSPLPLIVRDEDSTKSWSLVQPPDSTR